MKKLLSFLFVFLIFISVAFANETEIEQEIPFTIQENYDITYKSVLTFLDIYNCEIHKQDYKAGYIEAEIPDANFSRCEYILNISSQADSTKITATNITLNQKKLKKKKKDRVIEKNNSFFKEEIEKCVHITKKELVLFVACINSSYINLNVHIGTGIQNSSSFATYKPIFKNQDIQIEEMILAAKKDYKLIKTKTEKELYKSKLHLQLISKLTDSITLVAQNQSNSNSVIVGYIFLGGKKVSSSYTNIPYGMINLHCDISEEVYKQIIEELK